jgi:signal transduction histidine kinase
MQQILHSLISNAIKFTPDGGQVTLEAARQNEGIIFRVRDTGIGMAPEDIPVALERFGQIDNSLARQYEGTGIGLPLAKELVELHGGTLEIESEVGVGTIVTLRFPEMRLFSASKVA